MKKDNFNAINEMRNMLGTVKKLTLESFIMPEEDVAAEQGEREIPAESHADEHKMQREVEMPKYNDEVKQHRRVIRL